MKAPVSLGLDLGTVNIKLLLTGSATENQRWVRPSHGDPLRVSLELIDEVRRNGVQGPVALAVTGAGAAAFRRQALERGHEVVLVNEILAAAAAVSQGHPAVRTVIDLGGQFTKWILLERPERGMTQGGLPRVEDFALNGRCAAGSGAFLEQQAARLRLSPGELGELAQGSSRGATIAGRCSVFAKSDMIHLQQLGTPPAEIAYGLCQSLARTFLSTVLQGRAVESPVAFVGGGASNAGLVRAFVEALGLESSEAVVASDHHFVCAAGAALLARGEGGQPLSLDQWASPPVVPVKTDISGAPSISTNRCTLPRLVPSTAVVSDEADLECQPRPAEGHLGIDVGSVSTNVVVLAPNGGLLASSYVATRGRPVEALDEALGAIEQQFDGGFQVLSVGATGSGRFLAARLVGADVVHNEITAQLLSAADVEPAVDTVFEIGGQDSKFIDARGGRLHDFEMNKICAAGTGSFLEEQADRLGVDIVGQFAELAFRGTNPIDLGSRCTVFMDSELGHAMAGGAAREDLCAGLAYAVARNYLEKVVGGRTIGRNVVFQGGTSANRAVVSAFEQLLRRPVKAHPQGRVSGAIGAALLAARSIDSNLGRDGFRNGPSSSFRGFDSCRGHGITSFECAACENRCRVNQVRVNGRVAHFGDVCERYTARHRRENTTSRGSGSRLFPELFAARHELFQRFVPATEVTGQSSRGRRVGLIRSSLMVEFLPFWTHLLQELDCHPVVAGPPKRGTHWGGGGLPSDVCHPIKLAHGQVHSLLEQDAADVVLLPSILELEERHGGDRAHTCLYVQQLPEMARLSFGDRVLTPQLGISSNPGLEREAIRQLARVLGKTVRRTRRAWRAALSHQLAFGVARRRLGQEALQALARGGPATDGGSRSAVVVLGKPYNLHEPTANLGLARHLERIGLPAIPMDLLPLDDEYLDASWYMLAWQFNRDQVRALQYAAARCDGTQLYPIHLSSYGCGPDAFTVKHLERAWAGRPRLFLEFDEHHGEAGLVTRLEAFADEIAEHRRQRPSRKGSLISPECRRNRDVPRGTRCLLPYTSAHVHVYAGALQRAGLRTRILERPDAETLRLGEEVSSGRECHPYAIIAGDLAKVVVQGNFDEGDRFFFPSTRLPCLLGQYGDGLRGVIESLGAKGITVFDQHPGEAMPMMGPLGMIHLYEGLTMIDYLIIAGEYYRPRLAAPEHLEQVLEGCYRLVERCVADGADGRTCFRECLRRLESLPRRPYASRPVIGVTGDLYTRVNEVGNADLFRWLDEMGCEVWPSPFFAASTDFELPQNARRWLGRGSAKVAVRTSAIASILGARSARLAACLNGVLRQRCVESSQRTLQRYAVRYVGANSNHLIRGLAAKMADFAARGAHGVVSAVGLGCMVGTAAASAIPAIRRDYDGIPIASISYGGAAGPAQLIQQETFVQQAMDRFERRRCASSPSAGH